MQRGLRRQRAEVSTAASSVLVSISLGTKAVQRTPFAQENFCLMAHNQDWRERGERTNIASLPTEILCSIARLVEQTPEGIGYVGNLAQFVRVCKEWREIGKGVARRLSTVILSSPEVRQNLEKHVSKHLDLFPNAESISFHGSSNFLPPSLFQQAFEVCSLRTSFKMRHLHLVHFEWGEDIHLPASVRSWHHLESLIVSGNLMLGNLPVEVGE